jgi:hypothetical protein
MHKGVVLFGEIQRIIIGGINPVEFRHIRPGIQVNVAAFLTMLDIIAIWAGKELVVISTTDFYSMVRVTYTAADRY